MQKQSVVLCLIIIAACKTAGKPKTRSAGEAERALNLSLVGIEITLQELQSLRFPVITFVKGNPDAEVRYHLSKKGLVLREGRTMSSNIFLADIPAGEHDLKLQACVENRCGQTYSLSYLWPTGPKNADEEGLVQHLKEQENYKNKIIEQGLEVSALVDELGEFLVACPSGQNASQREAIESFGRLKQEERDNFFLFGDLSKFTHSSASATEPPAEPKEDEGPDGYAVAEAYLSLPLVVGLGYLIVSDVKDISDWHVLRKRLRGIKIDGREVILERHKSGLLVPPADVAKSLKSITHRYFEDPLTKELVVDVGSNPHNFFNFDPESVGMYYKRDKATWVDRSSHTIIFQRDVNSSRVIIDQAKGRPSVNPDLYTFKNDQLVVKNNIDESAIRQVREVQLKNVVSKLPEKPRVAGLLVNLIAISTVFTVIFSGFQTFGLTVDESCARLHQHHNAIKTKLEAIEAFRMEWVKHKILVLSRI